MRFESLSRRGRNCLQKAMRSAVVMGLHGMEPRLAEGGGVFEVIEFLKFAALVLFGCFGAPWLLLWAIGKHDEWARVKYGKETTAVWERPSIKVALQKAVRDREVPVNTILEAIVADWLKEGGYLK